MDIGSAADWLAAGGGIASAVFAWSAKKLAGQANQIAEESKADAQRSSAEAKQLAQEALDKDKERDLRERAAHLQAWWVRRPAAGNQGKDLWGLMLANEAGAAVVFREVVIATTSNDEHQELKLDSLPPGRFFARSGFREDKDGQKITHPITGAWVKGFVAPIPCAEADGYLPVFFGHTHSVDSISFRDAVGCRWAWTPETGLQRLVG